MALLECVDCKGMVSNKAEHCPHCGCPIDEIIKGIRTAILKAENICIGLKLIHYRYGVGVVEEVCADKFFKVKFCNISRKFDFKLIKDYSKHLKIFPSDNLDYNEYYKDGYNLWGYDKNGYDENGFDKSGYDANGFDAQGYNKNGFNKYGYNKSGQKVSTCIRLVEYDEAKQYEPYDEMYWDEPEIDEELDENFYEGDGNHDYY